LPHRDGLTAVSARHRFVLLQPACPLADLLPFPRPKACPGQEIAGQSAPSATAGNDPMLFLEVSAPSKERSSPCTSASWSCGGQCGNENTRTLRMRVREEGYVVWRFGLRVRHKERSSRTLLDEPGPFGQGCRGSR
jgi:hypothetical protein